jgi:hypothetical protein
MDEWGCAIGKGNGVENGTSNDLGNKLHITGPIIMLPLS